MQPADNTAAARWSAAGERCYIAAGCLLPDGLAERGLHSGQVALLPAPAVINRSMYTAPVPELRAWASDDADLVACLLVGSVQGRFGCC